MSFDNLLVHDLVIERVTYDDTPATRDEAGQPTATTTQTAVRGMVQPRAARELADFRSAGSEIGDHVIFLAAATDVRGADRILWGDRVFNPTGVRRLEFGTQPHIEVDAQLVTATPVTVTVGGS